MGRVGGGVETTPHPFVVLRMIQFWLKRKKKLLIQICFLVIDIHVHDWYVLFFVFAGKGKLVSKDSKEYKQLLSDTSVLSESIKEQGNSVKCRNILALIVQFDENKMGMEKCVKNLHLRDCFYYWNRE